MACVVGIASWKSGGVLVLSVWNRMARVAIVCRESDGARDSDRMSAQSVGHQMESCCVADAPSSFRMARVVSAGDQLKRLIMHQTTRAVAVVVVAAAAVAVAVAAVAVAAVAVVVVSSCIGAARLPEGEGRVRAQATKPPRRSAPESWRALRG
eukprot:436117-Rhodomonas_salina.1